MTDTLSRDLLAEIINSTQTTDTEAIALVGSYARGNPQSYSDVDITHYVKQGNNLKSFTYYLIKNYKISLYTTTLDDPRKQFQMPESAIWIVPYLKTAKILYDPEQKFAVIQKEAINFHWEKIQGKANEYTNQKLVKYSEEVISIISGIRLDDDYAVHEALHWLYPGMAMTMAVQKGIFLDNEKTALKTIQYKMGPDSKWSEYLRIAGSLEDARITHLKPIQIRGIYALKLYRETVKILHPFITAESQKIINHALAHIEKLLESYA